MDIHNKQNKIPLFRDYPELEKRLPYVHLGTLPTPVEEMKETADNLGIEALFIKRDDLSGAVYGGNKVRKLEFLLGEIAQSDARIARRCAALGFFQAFAKEMKQQWASDKSIFNRSYNIGIKHFSK